MSTDVPQSYWLFVWLGFYVPLENFSLIWRRHNYRWRAANFDLCSALMAIEQWEFFSMPHLLWHGHPFIMVISEDPWHLYLLPSVWQWSWHDLGMWRLGFEHPWNLPHARQTLLPTAPPRQTSHTDWSVPSRELAKTVNGWILYLYTK